MFEVGDIVEMTSTTNGKDHELLRGHKLEIVSVDDRYNDGAYQFKDFANVPKWFGQSGLTLIRKKDMKELPQFVRLSRNTELFKKGSVFQLKTNYYEALDNGHAYIDEAIGSRPTPLLQSNTVTRLPNTFVPVIKFDPEYVTEEENKVLQSALKKGKK